MSSEQQYVVIVDALSTGALLAPCFRQAGFDIIHISTPSNKHARFMRTFVPGDFDLCIGYDQFGEYANLLEFLSKFSIQCVLPGSDPGVITSEKLAISLGVHKNNPSNILV